MSRLLIAALCLTSLSGCVQRTVVVEETVAYPVATRAVPVGPMEPDPNVKRIRNDGEGGLILPDGTRVSVDSAGGFTLPNGDYVRRDARGGLNLTNGSRCFPDSGAGFVCP
jgi:hypothetical protein